MKLIAENRKNNSQQILSIFQQEDRNDEGFGLGFASLFQRASGYSLDCMEVHYFENRDTKKDVYTKVQPAADFMQKYWGCHLDRIILVGSYNKAHCVVAVRWPYSGGAPTIQIARKTGAMHNISAIMQKFESQTISHIGLFAPAGATKTEPAEASPASTVTTQEKAQEKSAAKDAKTSQTAKAKAGKAAPVTKVENPIPNNKNTTKAGVVFNPVEQKPTITYSWPGAVEIAPDKFEPRSDIFRSHVVMVTPTLAEVMLRYNKKNRTLSQKQVDTIALLIKQGEWHLNHQGVAFDTNGDLFDGQHRLHAIIKAKIACPIMVSYGLPPENGLYVDRGKRRNEFQQMQMNSNENAWITNTYGSIVNVIADVFPELELASSKDKNDFLTKHKEHFLTLSKNYHAATKKGIGSTPVKAALIMIMAAGVAPEKVMKAANYLCTGLADGNDGLGQNTMLACRNKIIDESATGKGGGFKRRIVFMVAWAVKNYLDGKECKRIPTKIEEFAYPVINNKGVVVYDPSYFTAMKHYK